MKKKVMWAVITSLLSVLTIYALFYNSGLSLSELFQDIKEASPLWLIAAALCMLGFIFFEGRSLVLILRTLGYPAKKRRGFLYASADIYFSSITPSATGGQPASAYFMHKDGVTAVEVTVSLILNLTMYTLAIITLGLISLIFFPGIFLDFSLPCKIMILIGIFAMLLLTVFFIILLKHQRIFLKFGNLFVIILEKLHFKTKAEKLKQKLHKMIEDYNECVVTLAGSVITLCTETLPTVLRFLLSRPMWLWALTLFRFPAQLESRNFLCTLAIQCFSMMKPPIHLQYLVVVFLFTPVLLSAL